MDSTAHSLFLGTLGYPALQLLLILTGIGSPIPEDLLLLTEAYLFFAGVFQWTLALAISATGVVVSDLMLYSAGRHIGWRPRYRLRGPFLSDERLPRVSGWFARWGHILVFVARVTPGTRALVFITAGVHAIPISSFLRYDILGAAVWVPAILADGHASDNRLGDLGNLVDSLSRSAIWFALGGVALFALWFLLGREESKL